MEEQTNVHIDWTCFVSDQFSDKKNLALAQFGNLPDGLFNAGMSDYDLLRYAKQGIIIPLENLIDKYMPNLQAVFEKYPEYTSVAGVSGLISASSCCSFPQPVTPTSIVRDSTIASNAFTFLFFISVSFLSY